MGDNVCEERDGVWNTNPSGVQFLWPRPILVRRFERSVEVNAELQRLFYGELEVQGGLEGTVYSSPDDILQCYQNPALQALFGYIDAVF